MAKGNQKRSDGLAFGFPLSASLGERAGVRCRVPRNADSFRQDLHTDIHVKCVLVDMKTLSAEICVNSFNCHAHARN